MPSRPVTRPPLGGLPARSGSRLDTTTSLLIFASFDRETQGGATQTSCFSGVIAVRSNRTMAVAGGPIVDLAQGVAGNLGRPMRPAPSQTYCPRVAQGPIIANAC